MTAKKKITDNNGVQVFPITHTKAVLDDNGNSVEQRLQEQVDIINQKQMEVGAVPSDITPTEGSTNWVTSGGVFKEFEKILQEITYDYSSFSEIGYYNNVGEINSNNSYRRTKLIEVNCGDTVECYTGTASTTIDNIAIFDENGNWLYGLDTGNGAMLLYTYKAFNKCYVVAQTRTDNNDSYIKVTRSSDLAEQFVHLSDAEEFNYNYESNNIASADLSSISTVDGFTSKRYAIQEGELVHVIGNINLEEGHSVVNVGINNGTSPRGIASIVNSTGNLQIIDIYFYVPQACQFLWVAQNEDVSISVYLADYDLQSKKLIEIEESIDTEETIINITPDMFVATSVEGVTNTDYIPVCKNDYIIAKTKGAYNRAQILVYDFTKTLVYRINNGTYSTDYVMEFDGYVKISDQTNEVQSPSAKITRKTIISGIYDELDSSPKSTHFGIDDFNRNLQFFSQGTIIRYQRNNDFLAMREIRINKGDAVMLHGSEGYIAVFNEKPNINGNSTSIMPVVLQLCYDVENTTYLADNDCWIVCGAKYGDGYLEDVYCEIYNEQMVKDRQYTIQESMVNFDQVRIIPRPNDTDESTQEASLVEYRGHVYLYQTWYNDESGDQEIIGREYDIDNNTCGELHRIAYRGVLGNDGTGNDPNGFSRSFFFVYNSKIYGFYLDALNKHSRLICSNDGLLNWELVATDMFPTLITGNYAVIPYKIDGCYYFFGEHGGTGAGWQMFLYRSTAMESGWELVGALSFDGESTGMNGGAMPFYQDGKFKLFYHYGPTGLLPTYLAYAEADFNDPLHFHKIYEPLMYINHHTERVPYGDQYADVDVRNIGGNCYMTCSLVKNASSVYSDTLIWKCNGNIYDIMMRKWKM